MGGSSKKVTVGYKYYIGMHMILCHGPVDRITRIRVDGRDAWVGENSGGGIYINKPSLFGGESREGGVQGTVDFETGGPEQGVNSYLSARLQKLVPSFRGVVGVVLRQVYIGVNPYLKKWAFRVQRIHVRQDGRAQWQPEIAEIAQYSFNFAYDGIWKYRVVSNADGGAPGVPSNYMSPTYDDSHWAEGKGGFGSNSPGAGFGVGTYISPGYGKGIWIRRTIHVDIPPGLITVPINIEIYHDDGAWVWWNGVQIPLSPTSNYYRSAAIIPPELIQPVNVIAVQVLDSIPGGSPSHIYAGLHMSMSGGAVADMNPAHIIRECLTDPDWGMGYAETDIDEVTFAHAANTLFNERFGLSLLWDRQIAIEDFIKEVLKHIDGVLYVERKSGKFVLKLIRKDYVKDDLIHLDESNIERIDDYGRPAFGELTNSVTVNYWNLSNSNDASVTLQDPALALMQQGVINTTIQYPGCTAPGLASRLAQRDLASLSTPRASCTIYAGRIAKDLNIGSTFRFSWEDYGVQDVVMRVTGIAYGDGRNNRIRIQCTQDTFDMPSTAYITPPATEWEDPQVAPQPMIHQYVFEVPYLELVQRMGQPNADLILGSSPETGFVGAAGARPSSATINARVYTDSGTGFEDAGLLDFSPFTTLSAGANKMATELFVGNIVDEEEIRLGSWAQIGDELVAIMEVDSEEGVLTVKRGVLDTVPLNHATGTPVIFWDDYLQGDETEYVESDVVDVKMTPVTGSGELDLDDAPVSSVTMGSRAVRPYPPGNFKLNGEYFPVALSLNETSEVILEWSHRDRRQQTGLELIGFLDEDVGPEQGTTYRVDCEALTPAGSVLWSTEDVGLVKEHTIDLLLNPPPVDSITLTFKVYSVRDGFDSFKPQQCEVSVFEPPFYFFGVYIP